MHKIETSSVRKIERIMDWETIYASILNETVHSFGGFLDISKIDGIEVTVYMDLVLSGAVESTHKEVRIRVFDLWKHTVLYNAFCISSDELKHYITVTLPEMRYNVIQENMHTSNVDYGHILTQHIPIVESIVLQYQECSVCLEPTKLKTSCKHSLCRCCESKIVPKRCPICRTHYNNSLNDDDEEE